MTAEKHGGAENRHSAKKCDYRECVVALLLFTVCGAGTKKRLNRPILAQKL